MCSQVLFLFKKRSEIIRQSEVAKQKKEKTDPKLLWTSSNRYHPKLLKEL